MSLILISLIVFFEFIYIYILYLVSNYTQIYIVI